jgi:hypothetical protein
VRVCALKELRQRNRNLGIVFQALGIVGDIGRYKVFGICVSS